MHKSEKWKTCWIHVSLHNLIIVFKKVFKNTFKNIKICFCVLIAPLDLIFCERFNISSFINIIINSYISWCFRGSQLYHMISELILSCHVVVFVVFCHVSAYRLHHLTWFLWKSVCFCFFINISSLKKQKNNNRLCQTTLTVQLRNNYLIITGQMYHPEITGQL